MRQSSRIQLGLALLNLLLLADVRIVCGAAADLTLTNVTALPKGGLHVEAIGTPGLVYSLQRSANLQEWRTLNFLEATAGEAAFDDVSAGLGQSRFYRVRAEPVEGHVTFTNYHGWSNSIMLDNGVVQTTIVPAIGRIMQFRFADQAEGPLWENPLMYGKAPTANSWDTTGAFGGDKVWPSPQSVWNWPPPRGFDTMAFTGAVTTASVTLVGPVDSGFGMRVVREIALHPTEPIMRVSSTFEKLRGSARQVGVWVITQVNNAERVFVPLPASTIFAKGYTNLSSLPKGLVVTNGLVSLARDPNASSKIGTDAGGVVWVGTNTTLLIESPRSPGVGPKGFPDGGCSAEVYTNPNPTPYIELELLGPLATLATNDTLSATSIYSLFRRGQAGAMDEAQSVLSR
jgi:hypothetical protein